MASKSLIKLSPNLNNKKMNLLLFLIKKRNRLKNKAKMKLSNPKKINQKALTPSDLNQRIRLKL